MYLCECMMKGCFSTWSYVTDSIKNMQASNPDPESKLSGASVCEKKNEKKRKPSTSQKDSVSPPTVSWVVEHNAAPALETVFLSISRSSLFFDNFLSFGAFRRLFSQTKKARSLLVICLSAASFACLYTGKVKPATQAEGKRIHYSLIAAQYDS